MTLTVVNMPNAGKGDAAIVHLPSPGFSSSYCLISGGSVFQNQNVLAILCYDTRCAQFAGIF